MLNRQSVLLHLLARANRPLLRVELVKWAFVLKHETASAGGSAFYDFLPFKKGPYSFNLEREIDHMVDSGLVQASDTSWKRSENSEAIRLPGMVERDISTVVERLRNLETDKLLRMIYDRYPEYTVNSEIARRAERPLAVPAIYTAGYEGLQIDAFLNRLIQRGIRKLIDVRHNPIARRYGFHKSTLSELCRKLHIEYIHRPEFGISSAERSGLDHTVSRPDLLNRYERDRLPQRQTELAEVATEMANTPSVLVCMEQEPCDCHRSRLAKELSRLTGLGIHDLGQSG